MSTVFGKTIKFISGFCAIKLVEENFISLNPSSGESMLPTIQPQNDWLLIWKFKLPTRRHAKDDQLEKINCNDKIDTRTKKELRSLTNSGYKIDNEEAAKQSFLRSFSILDNLEIGDVVVARKPTNSNVRVCKRVLGKEGDVILMDPTSKSKLSTVAYHLNVLGNDSLDTDNEGFVGENEENFIEDKIAELNKDESFIDCYNSKLVRVPKGHVWLGGDNTEFSVDSRNYGFVPVGLIEGKVIYHINFNQTFYKFEKIHNNYKDI